MTFSTFRVQLHLALQDEKDLLRLISLTVNHFIIFVTPHYEVRKIFPNINDTDSIKNGDFFEKVGNCINFSDDILF